MKHTKKIITLVLAVIMCLSVIIPVTAASTFNRIASTIPGTDIEYNYVDNVTVQIPGTEVTYELMGVYEKVGLIYEDGTKFDENFINIYTNVVDYPVYRFAFLQNGGKLKIKNAGEYASWFSLQGEDGSLGDGSAVYFEENEELSPIFTYPDKRSLMIHARDAGNVENPRVHFRLYETYIYEDGTCNASLNDGDCVAKVEFYFGYGGNFSNGRNYPYDLISFKYDKWWHIDDECYYYDDITADIEKIDISLLDINYEKPEYNYTFSIQTPSRTEIRNKDGIILHAKVDGTAPAGSYVRWESSNGNFDEDANGYDLEIIAKNKGWTTFTAILCAEDGTELARSSVEIYSKSGFFDKIGGFFRSLFGTTKIYDN